MRGAISEKACVAQGYFLMVTSTRRDLALVSPVPLVAAGFSSLIEALGMPVASRAAATCWARFLDSSALVAALPLGSLKPDTVRNVPALAARCALSGVKPGQILAHFRLAHVEVDIECRKVVARFGNDA